IITSISSMSAHNKRGGVRWDIWRNMALGLVIGSLVGAGVAEMIDGKSLQAIIGVGALLVAINMLFMSNKEQLGKPM
ncbi:sulfite exporter TauE/SafE family protein, partial [Psychrobacter sp. GW64-MNA-CIBAN-0177]